MEQQTQSQFHRFGIFTGRFDTEGELRKEKTVGFALMREGQDMYSLKLWTFPQEKYYLIPTKDDPSKILIMTREKKKVPTENRKYNWSIVGNGNVYNQKGVTQLDFDLLPQPIFMNVQADPNNFNNQNSANTLSVA